MEEFVGCYLGPKPQGAKMSSGDKSGHWPKLRRYTKGGNFGQSQELLFRRRGVDGPIMSDGWGFQIWSKNDIHGHGTRDHALAIEFHDGEL